MQVVYRDQPEVRLSWKLVPFFSMRMSENTPSIRHFDAIMTPSWQVPPALSVKRHLPITKADVLQTFCTYKVLYTKKAGAENRRGTSHARRHARGHKLQRCRHRVGLLINLYSVSRWSVGISSDQSKTFLIFSVSKMNVSFNQRNKTCFYLNIYDNDNIYFVRKINNTKIKHQAAILALIHLFPMSFQDHLSSCDHSLIQCVHPQCRQDVKRSLLAQHLETECLYRQVSCTYCNGTFPFNSLKVSTWESLSSGRYYCNRV